MTDGTRSINVPQAASLDDVLGHKDSTLSRCSISSLNDQLTGGGGSKAFETWARLDATTGSFEGERAEVFGDTGLHTDPVTSDINIPNSGVYRWSTSPVGWKWISANALSTKANTNSPALNGTPTAPTPAADNYSTRIATTEFVLDSAGKADFRPARRPGENLALFSASQDGAPESIAALSGGVVYVGVEGPSYRVTGAAKVCAREAIWLDANRTFRVRTVYRRITNPLDPLGDAVETSIVWLDKDYAQISAVAAVNDSRATVANGQRQAAFTFPSDAITPPGGAVYARLKVETFGADGVTDIEELTWYDSTEIDVLDPANISAASAQVADDRAAAEAAVTDAEAAAASAAADAAAASASASSAATSASLAASVVVGETYVKLPVRAATKANVTLSGLQTIDGVSLLDGERVLVWQQTTGQDNGVYNVHSGAWTRATDFDTDGEAVGAVVVVQGGNSYTGSIFRLVTEAVTLGTTPLVFVSDTNSGRTHADTAAQFATTSFAADVHSANILGYYEIGVGASKLRRTMSEPTHPAKFRSADRWRSDEVYDAVDGGWWEFVSDDNSIDPLQLGAYGDDTNDDTTFVQNTTDWIFWNIAQGNGIPFMRISRLHKVTDTLKFFDFTGGEFNFTNLTIEGTAPSYLDASKVGFDFTSVVDRPAIVYQAMRRLVFKRLAILGGANDGMPSLADMINDDTSPWWNTHSARDSESSPYCAIAGDPFSVDIPGDGGYPSLSAYYGISPDRGSSDCLFEECFIRGFIVGAAIGLSASTQIGDHVRFKSSTFRNNKVHVAIGQDQDRGVLAEDCLFIGGRTLQDTTSYGNGRGDPMKVRGGISVNHKYLINAGGDYFPHGLFNGHYSEELWSIGDWTSDYIFVMRDCSIKFLHYGLSAAQAPNYHLRADKALLSGGNYLHYDGNEHRLSIAGSAVIENATLGALPVFTDVSRSVVRNCSLVYGQGSYGVSSRFEERLSTIGGNTDSYLNGGELVDPAGISGVSNPPLGIVYKPATNWMDIYTETVSVTVNGDGTASFTSANVKAYYHSSYPNDTLMTLTSKTVDSAAEGVTFSVVGLVVGRITGISGNVVSLDEVPKSLTTGSIDLYIRRLGTIRQRGTAVLTNGSTNVTGVTSGVWRAGHFIFGTGIPYGCRVASASGTTLTLSMNATTSATVEIYDAYLTVAEAWTSQAVGAPTGKFFRRGEKVKFIDPPAVDGNGNMQTGFICSVGGNSPTFVSLYEKSTTP